MNDVEQFLKRYFSVLVRSQSYLNMTYLLISFPLGLFYFIFLITGLSVGFPTIILFVGLFILVAVFAVSWGLSAFERGLAISLLRVKIPPMAKQTPSNAGFWQRVNDYLTNPVTWKGLLYLFCKFPLGIINFTLVVCVAAVSFSLVAAPFVYRWVTYDIGFMRVNSLSDALLVMIAGLLLAPAGFHLLNFLARIQGEFARIMLGQASHAADSTGAPQTAQVPPASGATGGEKPSQP